MKFLQKILTNQFVILVGIYFIFKKKIDSFLQSLLNGLTNIKSPVDSSNKGSMTDMEIATLLFKGMKGLNNRQDILNAFYMIKSDAQYLSVDMHFTKLMGRSIQKQFIREIFLGKAFKTKINNHFAQYKMTTRI